MGEIRIPELDVLLQEVRRLHDRLDEVVISKAPEWVSIKQAAEIMDVHPSTIHRKIASGEMEAKGSGATRRVKLP